MKQMLTSKVGTIRMEFIIPSRGLLGFRSELLMMTRGTGLMYQNFHDYQPSVGDIPERKKGVLISQTPGKAVSYALWKLQERGEIFISPGEELYEGMIVGVNNKGPDLVVNAIREKKLTNMRASGADDALYLVPPRKLTLEFAIEFIEMDELVEVTPKNIRLRKRYLTENQRKSSTRG